MKRLGIIPARFASTRFPGKPLVDILGKPMIQRVYERALAANCFDEVLIATDDQRIVSAAEKFGATALMTAEHHQSGTDRCAEIAALPSYAGIEIVVNIQGDEPFLDPSQLNELVGAFDKAEVDIATIAVPLTDMKALLNPNTPKVVTALDGSALYFSRSAIPFQRGAENEEWTENFPYLRHIGLYAFRKHCLLQVAALEVSPLEKVEALEQLRWLQNGFRIQVLESAATTRTIDTPEDLAEVVKAAAAGELMVD